MYMACNRCLPQFQQLLHEKNSLENEVLRLGVKVTVLESKCERLEEKCASFDKDSELWEQIDSEYVQPSSLRLSTFASYLAGVVTNFPIIGLILNLFISDSHIRKSKAAKTNKKWLMWSYFYQSWLADIFLRSRAPKSIRRTTLLVSAYLLLGNVSHSCWRLLQHLKVVASKEVVEKWIKSFKKNLHSNNSFLFHVVDNCDIKLHVTKVRTTHRTQMMHLVSRYDFMLTFFFLKL